MKSKKMLKVLLIALAVVAAGVVFTFAKDSGADESVLTEDAGSASADESGLYDSQADVSADAYADETDETVCVHVCGAVNNPGVYYLEAGSRVHEAVELAGGLTEDAADEYVNLAQVVTDGEQIYIPTLEEAAEEGLEAGSASQSDSSDSSGLININTASSEELQSLPGIGESKAAAIISYREENGAFESAQDITNVSGIGDSTYENIKDYITV